MSFFSALGQKGLATFAQTMENIGNIVAPIPDDDEGGDNDAKQDDDQSFENKMQKFIFSKRDEIQSAAQVLEPPSPTSSLVDVDLNDDSDHCNKKTDKMLEFPKQLLSSRSPVINTADTSSVFLSNTELEKRVQLKYRESLESEVSMFDTKFRELESAAALRLSDSQHEASRWKSKAQRLEVENEVLRTQLLQCEKEQPPRMNDQTCQNCNRYAVELSELASSMQRGDEVSSTLSAQLLEASSANERLNSELSSSQRTCVELTETINELEMQSVSRYNELRLAEQRFNDLVAQHTALQRLQENLIDNSSAEAETDHLSESRIAELELALSQLFSEKSRADAEIYSLRSELAAACEEVARRTAAPPMVQIESTPQSLSGSELEVLLQISTAECDSLRQRVSSLELENKIVSQRLADEEKMNSEARGELHALTVQLEEQAVSFSVEKAEAEKAYADRCAALNRDLEGARAEMLRLNDILAQSEAAVKATEEVAWQAKAEASEMLFALQLEEGKTKELRATEAILRLELGAAQGRLTEQLSRSPEFGVPDAAQEKEQSLRPQLLAAHHAVLRSVELLHSMVYTYAGDSTAVDVSGSIDMRSRSSSVSESSSCAEVVASLSRAASLLDGSLRQLSAALKRSYEEGEQLSVVLSDTVAVLDALMGATPLTSPISRSRKSADSTPTSAQATLQSAESLLSQVRQAAAAHKDMCASSEELRLRVLELEEELERVRAESADADSLVAASSQESASAKRDYAAAVQQVEMLTGELQSVRQVLLRANEAQAAAERETQRVVSSCSDSAAALLAAKKEIQRLETEGRQLHQVIAQLRQARKATKGDEESAVQERDELRAAHASLLNEVARLEKSLAANTASAEQVTRLRGDLSAALNKVLFLEQSLEEAKRQLASLESISYTKQSQLDGATADLLLARTDLEQRSLEVRNLVEALAQIQRDREVETARAQRLVAEQVQRARGELDETLRRREAEWKLSLERSEALRMEAEQTGEAQQLRLRKAEMDFSAEKRRVQKTLEGALSQLSNSQSDAVDRMLIANLIVSYFRKRRSAEVMELIARVLGFTDEQKVVVGLKVAPTNIISSLIATVIGTGTGGDASADSGANEPQGENLAEQWINFLITEAEVNGPVASPATTPRKQQPS